MKSSYGAGTLLLGLGFLFFAGLPAGRAEPSGGEHVDLAKAALVLPAGTSGPERAAAEMLVEEVEKHSELRWPVVNQLPADGQPAVVLGQRTALLRDFPALAGNLKTEGSDRAEGYQIVALPSRILVAGNDARGVLFGAGRLLRLLEFSRGGVTLAPNVNLVTAPHYPLRGHELCYRPKTNTYDGWSPAMYEQYIRELIIYGTNAIEMAAPRSDDAVDSPHFTLPPVEMDAAVSRIAQKYGIEFWMWYPTLDSREFDAPYKDYSDPATVALALKEWGDVLRQIPRVDAMIVPGGDPGRVPPKLLFPLVEAQAAQLRTIHPQAKVWITPQEFKKDATEEFYQLLSAEPAWLDGIAYAPWNYDGPETLRSRVPARYLIRAFPDITHDFRSQYPVPDWDYAYAVTEHRESINPRPVDYAALFHRILPFTREGFITYSEGCNDDVNKIVWTALGWDPEENVTDILRDYSHYFIGSAHGEEFAQGLSALERNWSGPLAANASVYSTLERFQALERTATPEMLHSWRFEEGLYRAYYDATDRARLLVETAQEEKAVETLHQAHALGSLVAIAAAEKALTAPLPSPTPPGTDWQAWRARVFELAEGLFQTIHMQLSVPRYQAESTDRGANLDTIDYPMTDAPWIEDRFKEITAVPDETERLARIDEIVDWCSRGAVMQGPLELTFHHLDKKAHYHVQLFYGSVNDDRSADPMKVRLVANGKYEVHSMQDPRLGGEPGGLGSGPVPFDIPVEETAGGELRLTWTPSAAPHNGSGLQVKGIWLNRDAAQKMNQFPEIKRSPYPR